MIGIITMPIGNLQSVWNALHENGFDCAWVDETTATDAITHLIVPGVGHFRAVMQNLESRELARTIRAFAASGRPLLGICAGMQLLASLGTEGGAETRGLDLIPGRVDRMPERGEVRLPHVGWNTVALRRAHPVFEGIKPRRDFYFAHAYALGCDTPADCLGETDHGEAFASVVARANVIGVQFHPEKSQANGIRLLANFCNWDGGRC